MTATRAFALGALAVAALLIAVLLLGGNKPTPYKVRFQNAGQLVNGDDVQIGGRRLHGRCSRLRIDRWRRRVHRDGDECERGLDRPRRTGANANRAPIVSMTRCTAECETPNSGPSWRMVRFVRQYTATSSTRFGRSRAQGRPRRPSAMVSPPRRATRRRDAPPERRHG